MNILDERTLEGLIQTVNDSLVDAIGLESATYFLDHLATKGPSPWEDVVTYIKEKSSSRVQVSPEKLEVVYSRIREQLSKIMEATEPSLSTKIVHSLKYDLFARLCQRVPLIFMDYGYHSHDPLPLGEHDPNFRYAVQLYHFITSLADIQDQRVLEVGSGNGGGADYVFRTFSPHSFLGIDICFANVRFSNDHFQREGLEFRYGDAEQLPLPDGSVDAILNVESFHLYPNPLQSLQEAHRVLTPGGRLLIADLFKEQNVMQFRQLATGASFVIEREENITRNVSMALPPYIEKLQSLAHRLPTDLQPFYMKFIGSRSFNKPESNWSGPDLLYSMFVLRKN